MKSLARLILIIAMLMMFLKWAICFTQIIGGQGIVTEAARALLEVGFTLLNLHKIEIECYGYNKASQRIAEKLGFTLEARIRDRKDAQGNRCDSLIYGLLRSEWEGR